MSSYTQGWLFLISEVEYAHGVRFGSCDDGVALSLGLIAFLYYSNDINRTYEGRG